MTKIDLHKLALVVGFELVCVDEEYTHYEYMVRLRDIESISYVLKLKNDPNYSDVDNIISSIIIVLPRGLRHKVKKLMRRKDEENINNIIDLLCYTISEYKNRTKYSLLKQYGDLLGIDIEKYGYYFTYKVPQKKYVKMISLIETKLSIEEAPIVGKLKKLEQKISYAKQHRNS